MSNDTITIAITLHAPELVGAIRQLAEAIGGKPAPQNPLPAERQDAAVLQTPPAVPVAPAAVVSSVQGAAVLPLPANPVPVGTAPTYTLEALARAGATLVQLGKMREAVELLAKYGVQTVNQLMPEQYGAFATELRALGAQV